MQPAAADTTTTTTTTTTTEIWQWQCAACRADWKMLRQVTTTRCHGTPPPPAGNPPLSPQHHHHHHHGHRHHRHEEGATGWALPTAEGSSAGRKKITTLNPAPHAVAQVSWVPDPGLMVQQLREFESLNDEVVALRVQLQEYAEEIERSVRMDDDSAGANWFLALPANVRDVLVMARDAIDSFIAVSATDVLHQRMI